jgi:hypothetical protein
MAKKSKRLRIHVRAEQKVHYDQVIEMSAEEWEKLKDKSPHDAAEELQDRLDLRDIYDAEPLDYDEFTAVVVDKQNKPVKPSDEYAERSEW